MTHQISRLLTTLLTPLTLLVIPATADVIASTNFDGRTLTEVNTANDTATGLNWVVNGILDPGNMTSLNATGGPLALFNTAGKVTENMFAPAINTGNGNTFWTTSINLTVAPGSTVTLTDVTFDNWSVNAGQDQNVNRRSDFTITLLDPSGASIDTVELADSLSGTAAGIPTVTIPFTTPIALPAAGTYKLVIKGGDFAGTDETGNHTAIDNFIINGTVISGGPLEITNISYSGETDSVTLIWNSVEGESYMVAFSTDLADWTADLDDNVVADAGDSTTRTFELAETQLSGAPRAFFRVERKPAGN
jgi:hypothetical protein